METTWCLGRDTTFEGYLPIVVVPEGFGLSLGELAASQRPQLVQPFILDARELKK